MSMSRWRDRGKKKRDDIFCKLILKVRETIPSEQLSAELRQKLECQSLQGRSQLVNQTHDDCTPLFIAARNGSVEIVRYLLETCGADLEQISDPDPLVAYMRPRCTSLSVAAFAGKIEVCRVLVGHGADVNTMSGKGLTASLGTLTW